jgi:hypothetical protein
MSLRLGLPNGIPVSCILRFCAWSLATMSFALTASGCASLDAPATRFQAVKTIGIVSAIGYDFTMTKAGLAAPGEIERHGSIAQWGLDDLVATRTGARLAQRFQIVPLTYSRASFAVQEQNTGLALLKQKGMRDAVLSELVRSRVSPQGLDAYLVVTFAESPYGSRGRTVRGIGAIEHMAVMGSSALLHALYTITVVDGHTFQIIDKKSAPPMAEAELFRLAGPSREIDVALLSAAADPGRSDQLRTAVIDLIDRSLGATLQNLQLIDRSAL